MSKFYGVECHNKVFFKSLKFLFETAGSVVLVRDENKKYLDIDMEDSTARWLDRLGFQTHKIEFRGITCS